MLANTCKTIALSINDSKNISKSGRRKISTDANAPFSIISGSKKGRNVARNIFYRRHPRTQRQSQQPSQYLLKIMQLMVEPRGVEPLTSCMPCKRSTS